MARPQHRWVRCHPSDTGTLDRSSASPVAATLATPTASEGPPPLSLLLHPAHCTLSTAHYALHHIIGQPAVADVLDFSLFSRKKPAPARPPPPLPVGRFLFPFRSTTSQTNPSFQPGPPNHLDLCHLHFPSSYLPACLLDPVRDRLVA